MVSEQWFVKTGEVAKKAIQVVEDDEIIYLPGKQSIPVNQAMARTNAVFCGKTWQPADVGTQLIVTNSHNWDSTGWKHPLAGIAAAFAGVSGGFSANFVPSAIDPLLQSFTQIRLQQAIAHLVWFAVLSKNCLRCGIFQ